MPRVAFSSLLILLVVGGGCAEELRPNPVNVPPSSGAFTHTVNDDGSVTTVADATDLDARQYLDLDSGEAVQSRDGWDLSFRRFLIHTNGGISGTGGVQVAVVRQPFGDVDRAPEMGWSVDMEDGDGDDDSEPDNLFNNGTDDWYAYEEDGHTLTPRPDKTYVVATTESRFFKLRVDGYYDDVGNPAVISFTWAEVTPPMSALPDVGITPTDTSRPPTDSSLPPIPADAVEIDATNPDDWVYIRIGGGVVTTADPTTDSSWDLGVRRSEVRTNSGTSGGGVGGARVDESTALYDDITETSTFGFEVDSIQTSGMPGAEPISASPALFNWFVYDPATHTLGTDDRAFMIRGGEGAYAKLKVWRWEDGVYFLSFDTVTRLTEVREIDVDASDEASWTYLSLRDGAAVEVTDAASEGAWDVGFSGTHIRTNGGTTGGGMGQAIEAGADIATITSAPSGTWTTDAMITDTPSGRPEFSGNEALTGWYDSSAGVAPRDVAYAVRTADGHLAALQVRSYAAGVYRVAVRFAGPNQTGF